MKYRIVNQLKKFKKNIFKLLSKIIQNFMIVTQRKAGCHKKEKVHKNSIDFENKNN